MNTSNEKIEIIILQSSFQNTDLKGYLYVFYWCDDNILLVGNIMKIKYNT